MKVSYRLIALTIAFSTACWSPSAFAQRAPGHFSPLPKPSNLQVLPKDISTQDLIKIMRGFEDGLGVRCTYCHAQDPQTHRLNFALDTKPEKSTARIMIRMTDAINAQYMATLPAGAVKISCYTCHRGSFLPALEAPPHSEGEDAHSRVGAGSGAQPPAPPQ